MEKREGELKQAFTVEFEKAMPSFVVQRFATAGSPDRSITGFGRTTHWEFKHGTPAFDSQGIQELVCSRLEVVGHCRYVVWQENAKGSGQRTLIVRPRMIRERIGWTLVPESYCIGFDHAWLVRQIMKAHRA